MLNYWQEGKLIVAFFNQIHKKQIYIETRESIVRSKWTNYKNVRYTDDDKTILFFFFFTVKQYFSCVCTNENGRGRDYKVYMLFNG